MFSLSGLGFLSLPATLFILALVSFTHAFIPSRGYARAALEFKSITHAEQTETAFEAAFKRHFSWNSGAKLPKLVIEARDTINVYQGLVDKDQKSAEKHFDGEFFLQGQQRLIDLKKAAAKELKKDPPNQIACWDNLGGALHTLQDFYSHTNWVELGNKQINDELGKEGKNITGISPIDEATCKKCPKKRFRLSTCVDCPDNVFTKKLTSGYYYGENSPVSGPIPPYKCRHGGVFDDPAGKINAAKVLLTGADTPEGINKDSLDCQLSPHYYRHLDAVKLSVEASGKFIDDLIKDEGLNEQQKRMLFNYRTTTGFSFSRLSNSTRKNILSIAQSRQQVESESTQYLITPYGSVPFTLPDFETLKQWADEAHEEKKEDERYGQDESYGDDDSCDSSCISNAVGAMKTPGNLFILSDKPWDLADGDLEEPTNEALENNIEIHVIDYMEDVGSYLEQQEEWEDEDDGDDENDEEWEDDTYSRRSRVLLRKRMNTATGQLYSALTSATGGKYHVISQAPKGDRNSPLSRIQFTQPDEPLDMRNAILKLSGTLKSKESFKIPIDSQMKSFTISASGLGSPLELTKPDGSSFDTSSSSATLSRIASSQYLTVKNPDPGSWEIILTPSNDATSISVNVLGISPLEFSRFEFVEMNGRAGHQGLFPIEGKVVANEPNIASAVVYGNFSNAEFSLRDAMNRVVGDKLEMTQGSGEVGEASKHSFVGDVTVPAGKYNVYVEGVDQDGKPFQRVWPKEVVPEWKLLVFNLV